MNNRNLYAINKVKSIFISSIYKMIATDNTIFKEFCQAKMFDIFVQATHISSEFIKK